MSTRPHKVINKRLDLTSSSCTAGFLFSFPSLLHCHLSTSLRRVGLRVFWHVLSFQLPLIMDHSTSVKTVTSPRSALRQGFLPASFPSGQSSSTHRFINPDQGLWMPHVYIWRLLSSLYKPNDEVLSPSPFPGSVKPHLCLSYLYLPPPPTVCTFVPPAFLKVQGKARR